jgi:hypothetical protein
MPTGVAPSVSSSLFHHAGGGAHFETLEIFELAHAVAFGVD